MRCDQNTNKKLEEGKHTYTILKNTLREGREFCLFCCILRNSPETYEFAFKGRVASNTRQSELHSSL